MNYKSKILEIPSIIFSEILSIKSKILEIFSYILSKIWTRKNTSKKIEYNFKKIVGIIICFTLIILYISLFNEELKLFLAS